MKVEKRLVPCRPTRSTLLVDEKPVVKKKSSTDVKEEKPIVKKKSLVDVKDEKPGVVTISSTGVKEEAPVVEKAPEVEMEKEKPAEKALEDATPEVKTASSDGKNEKPVQEEPEVVVKDEKSTVPTTGREANTETPEVKAVTSVGAKDGMPVEKTAEVEVEAEAEKPIVQTAASDGKTVSSVGVNDETPLVEKTSELDIKADSAKTAPTPAV